jgi:23S rRNA pseudouridine1911/1915/1917 synthase
MTAPPLQWTVPPDSAAERLDRHVARHLEVPRHQVQAWFDDGRVTVDRRARKPSFLVTAGMSIEAAVPPPPASEVLAEAGPLVVLHEDEHLLAIDKPAGLVVHPGAGASSGTLVHRLVARYPELATVGSPARPGIVHRLDKDTTGLILVARTQLAYQHLSAAFAARALRKEYVAIAYGKPQREAGTIEAPIARHPQRRVEMAVRAEGRPATTGYRILAVAEGLAWWWLDLHTGRTHQIRVHLKSAGHPLVGDPTYGEARWRGLLGRAREAASRFARPALHARRIELEHPVSRQLLRLEAPLPADLERLWIDATGLPIPPQA